MSRLRQALSGSAAVASRLRRMSRDEFCWRLRTECRARSQEAATAVRKPEWERADIRQALALDTLPARLQDAVERQDWALAHVELRRVLTGRRSRFALNAALSGQVTREIRARWPGAEHDAVSRAGAIAEGRLDLLGYRNLSFASPEGAGIDWHFDPVHQRRMPMAFWSRVAYLDPQFGDHKVVWEVNRQQHWLALTRALWLSGDRRFADVIVDDLEGWLAANPPLLGANWASMLELAFRSLSWLWGLHAVLDGDDEAGHRGPWLVDLLVALDRQLRHVESNLSRYFSPNTHLTGEALALYVAGAALPELAASTRWIDTGRAVLLDEIERQIEPDGGHVERSTHYHRYTLDFYLFAVLTARRLGDTEAEERFADAAARLAAFARAMADGRGRLPRIGDDDAGRLWPITGRDPADVRDSLALAAAVLGHREWAPWGVTEEVIWLTSNDPQSFQRALTLGTEDRRIRDRRTLPFRPAVHSAVRPERRSVLAFPDAGVRRLGVERRGHRADRRAQHNTGRSHAGRRTTRVFGETGFVTTETNTGDHLIIDAGPHGYLNGGHAHADALSIVLALRHKPLLVDPGTPTYTMDPALRDGSRSSASHNTVTIDNLSSAVPAGPFHWQTRADARLEIVRHNSRVSLIEARREEQGGTGHRRVLLATDDGYLVIDQITGDGKHQATRHWHFDPRWRIRCEGARALRLTHESGDAAWVLSDRGSVSLITGDEASAMGWVSPAYGVRVPTWTAAISETQAAPFTLVTWCGSAQGSAVPVLEHAACESDAGAPAVAVRIRSGTSECVSILRPGDAVARQPRGARASGVETDARAVQCTFDRGALRSLSIADGGRVRVSDVLTIEADAVMPDLHLRIVDDRLELYASTSPGHLRLTGELLRTITQVTGNTHTLRRLHRPQTVVTLTAADWAASVTDVEFEDHHDVRHRRVR